MSFDALRLAFRISEGTPQLTVYENAVLWYLANMHNEEYGYAWPSQERICAICRISKATLNRALLRLEAVGAIARQPGVGHRNTKYVFPGLTSLTETPLSPPETTFGTLVSHGDTIQLPKANQIQNQKTKAAPASGSGAETTGSKPMKMPKGVSVAAIAKAAKNEYADLNDEAILDVKRVNGKFTQSGLKDCWRRAHGKYVAGHLPALRDKEVGQLGQAYKRVGDALPGLILLCLQHWTKFTKHAATEAGAYNTPSKPSIAFFTRYVDSAMSLALKLEQQDAAQPAGTTTAEHLAKMAAKTATQPVQSIAQASAPKTVSLADIEAAYDEAGP